jgi:maleylpyruvate isomerase
MTTDTATPDLVTHLRWMAEGHEYFLSVLAQLSDEQLLAPSALPGWTGRHVLSHVGHNARALGRLAHWASTGHPTPMYSGPTARAGEIAVGAAWDVQRLRSFVEVEQDVLAAALDALLPYHWEREVVTAQGRHVRAAALPWMRTRELWIHATDLFEGADFSDFPPALLDELILDVQRRRHDAFGEVVRVRPTDRGLPPPGDPATPHASIEGRAADLARWLTGRGTSNVHPSDHSPLPALGPWL